jgi:hypothetical protein
MRLHINLVGAQVEWASSAWNPLTNADYSKRERVQEKFINLSSRILFKNFIHDCNHILIT